MKLLVYSLLIASLFTACSGSRGLNSSESENQPIEAKIDLVNIVNDKVNVVVNPGKITSETISFYIPKTVPGTYSTDNYGRLIDDLKAVDTKGNTLETTKLDDNTWSITNAQSLDFVTYKVNDSYDIAGELEIFSPAGTNIKAKDNFVLNLHGFIGYFAGKTELPYNITITKPDNLNASTSLTMKVEDEVATDYFSAVRYFEVIDNPIFYTNSAAETFMVDNMKVILDIHSPNNTYNVEQLLPNIEKMVKAQKNYLGDINNTDLYAILLYLSDLETTDANGFGALEHHTSTVVVLPETMPLPSLNQTMTDVVSHEFFHTLTPLNVHAEEIQFFDYNDPKMSEHLWMYEGVTEYFANHFQIHEKLIEEGEFLKRMKDKITNSRIRHRDDISFTTMSREILTDEYKDEFTNVYEKGALIAMVIDIILRDESNGESGILALMGKLSAKYGKETPFKDENLIPEITAMTSPTIGKFFTDHVIGATPINYNKYFEMVGIGETETTINTSLFMLDNQTPFIDVNTLNKEVFFPEGGQLNSMLEFMGVKAGDIIRTYNGKEYNLDNIRDLLIGSFSLSEGDDITMTVERDGQDIKLKGIYKTPTAISKGLGTLDLPATDAKVKLRNAWLYN